MKYCPIICDNIHTNVVALGLVSVWRVTQLDYTSSDDNAIDEMYSEDVQFQPELHNFCVTEISSGKLYLFK